MKLNLSSSSFSEQINSKISGLTDSFQIEKIVYDTRKVLETDKTVFFALVGEFRDGHNFINEAYKLGIRIFVISQNIEFQNYPDAQFHKVDSVLNALQLVAKKHREQFSYPVVAITGSVGKTTVKEWVYHLVCDKFNVVRSPKSYNSQLGVALSILEMNGEHNLALFEAGISKRDEMRHLEDMLAPDLAIFTSFGSAHAQNFASKEEHLQEKEKLFLRAKHVFLQENIPSKDIKNGELVEKRKYQSFIDNSPFQDEASIQNLILAIALAQHLGVSDIEIVEKIKTLPRLALRMETFEGVNGNTIINDAYNLDLDALTQSLEYQLSISNSKLRTAIIGIDGLSENEIQKIKHQVKSFNLYQCFYVQNNKIPEIDKIHQQVILIKGSRVSNVQRISNLFQLKKHKTRIEIDLNAIKFNLNYFRSLIHPSCKILVMVKASSYGSGAEKMGEFLEKNGIEYLGVAYADEGIELRKNGITLPILVMNAEEDSFEEIINFNLEPAIYSFEILEKFTKSLISFGKENYPVHLKFDTGMHRLGFEMQDVKKVIDLVLSQPELKIQSVYSHLADSDNFKNKFYTEKQISIFRKICLEVEQRISYPFMKHILNSEAISEFPTDQFDMVRLGIGMYGISSNVKNKSKLKRAISWKSEISQIKTIQKGDTVGYGRSFKAEKETQLAVIPVGYADGFRRNLSQDVGGMIIHGVYCPIIGNVCMDMTMLDVSHVVCKIGDEVEIIGENQTIEDLATKMQTIPYEVLTSFSKRMHRIYLEE